jgi:polyisoprenoid-binding protein YceI
MSWTIDFSHSELNFKARHMMISNVRGNFDKFTGAVNFDETNPAKTTVDIKVETASINTNEEKRDAHLRSADFFDSEKFPFMIFKSQKVEVIDETNARLLGDLTIRDVTRPASLDVEYLGKAVALVSVHPLESIAKIGTLTGTLHLRLVAGWSVM